MRAGVLQLFDMVSSSIGLDAQVYNKYYEAIRVLSEINGTEFMGESHGLLSKSGIGSDAYMQSSG
ncbi:MAG TPA: hypothetical protein VGS11_07775 [Candidatus Bathyarchaeia archaeon]|nr:hypothetical protein [Candidatus Bathyarchaeia archaeon]